MLNKFFLCIIAIPYVITSMLLSGCVYRFTNLNIRTPDGIKTVAIEAVYDTSRMVLSHEVLWEAVQEEIARDGHLHIVSRARSDALLRLHISYARQSSLNEEVAGDSAVKDPNVFDADHPPDYREFNNMPIAGKVSKSEKLQFNVQVDLWNLKTAKVIFARTYSLSGDSYPSSALDHHFAFVRAEEAQYHSMRKMSKTIAQWIVRDLLVGI